MSFPPWLICSPYHYAQRGRDSHHRKPDLLPPCYVSWQQNYHSDIRQR